MSLINKTKDKFNKFEEKGKAFFNYAEKVPKNYSAKKSFNFGKPKKIKKSFKSEGLQL
jgi:hypothetical protein